ncbi:acyl-CoA dehydrogenase family protein [Pseudomonas panipatensis]|uniref:Acyl-CoA dehydrogenase, N-terminal domain n=1 Tax=Pseudomonas panipatensis TaxID=428992 RepID=A0A1G8HFQ0_9PSED|nr:acyl-CoA dehydrogenase family protein [Pseudomonas panipatensis]SDI05486.1 Acyl-CoA dehydrogenase, N-terminal domain [Pseudomonas panipatensis]SMP57998.1 Acyl-CoA dehydrogenase, N-terminal domain [Pseudomonas panipatensis]
MSAAPTTAAAARPNPGPAPAGNAAWARALRDSGLLRLSLPRALGGDGSPWSEILQTLRDLCERDGALARLFAVHHLQLTRVRLLGSREQGQRLLPLTLLRDNLWGALGEPGERRLLAVEHVRGGFRINGLASDGFAAEAADWLLLWAWHGPSRASLLAALPKERTGLAVQASRGAPQCQALRLHPEDILVPPGLPATPRTVWCDSLALLLQANLALGLAQHAAERQEQPRAAELSRLLGLGLRLSAQAAVLLDEGIEAGAALSFSRSHAFANLVAQTVAVAQQAAQQSLRAEGLNARLRAAAH